MIHPPYAGVAFEYWAGPGTAIGKALDLAAAAVTSDPGKAAGNERVDLP
ncbi:hypothetical protein [Luteimonas salinilitoris]|uniref:Uncharacterized protein n=1 Tax=Luteimonas salinilitoris TaxID=3237697 RepID=A0ABV4HLM5_9GAMM